MFVCVDGCMSEEWVNNGEVLGVKGHTSGVWIHREVQTSRAYSELSICAAVVNPSLSHRSAPYPAPCTWGFGFGLRFGIGLGFGVLDRSLGSTLGVIGEYSGNIRSRGSEGAPVSGLRV